jgi:catechol 2,3-dioxygenase-like lactoylglutathione lyase family enzyme
VNAPRRGNPFGHVDLRVRSLAEALPFYEALLPELGFRARYDSEDWKTFATDDPLPAAAYFGITESAEHVPNENRIAFWAENAEEVDRLAAIAEGAGGREADGPKGMPYRGVYAFFFCDPSGNRFEIYNRPPD